MVDPTRGNMALAMTETSDVWDLRQKKIVKSLPTEENNWQSLLCTNDNRNLLFGNQSSNVCNRLDLKTMIADDQNKLDCRSIVQVTTSKAGTHIYAATSDGKLLIYEANQMQKLSQIEATEG